MSGRGERTRARCIGFLLNRRCCWYRTLPNMPEARAFLGAFENLVGQREDFGEIFAAP